MQTARERPKKKRGKVWRKRSDLSWKTDVKTAFEVSHQMRYVTLLALSEEKHSPPTFAKVRMLFEARRAFSFNPATGGVEAVPRHTEISNKLARKICRGLSVPEIG